MTTVRFGEVDDRGRFAVTFPYDPDAVETIKRYVPGPFRSWDAGSKTWRVDEDYAEELTEAFISRGHDVVHGNEPAKPAEPELPVTIFTEAADKNQKRARAKAKAAEIIADLPGQDVHAVFRQMSRQLYPDLFKR